MLKIEATILKWIEEKIWIFAFIAFSIIGIAVRYALRDVQSPDYEIFLSRWYDEIKNAGGVNALGTQVGNYSMPYQTIIYLLTCLPIDSLYAYKLVSCIFDSALVFQLSGNDKVQNACIAYALTLLSPVVVLNSAAWAQCDAIYVFFCIASVMALINDKYALAFILYGLAFAFKLQAIFLFPFLIIFYCLKKKFSVFYFFYTVLAMILSSLPNLLVGRGVKDLYHIYRKQAKQYYLIHMNYPSFWAVLNRSGEASDYIAYKWMAIWITIAVLGFLMVMIWKNKIEMNRKNSIYVAFISVYTCVLFLPVMHERYGFCYEILAIIILFFNKKTIIPMFLIMFLSCSTYGHYLFGTEIDLRCLGVINTAVYMVYCYLLWRDAKVNGEEKSDIRHS